jgi:hypothetical protein
MSRECLFVLFSKYNKKLASRKGMVGWLDNSGWQGNLLVLLTILSSTLAQSKMIKSKAFEIILSLLLLSAKALNLNLRTSLQ